MKILKKIILIILILISILVILIVTSKKDEEKNVEQQGDIGEQIDYENIKIEDVSDNVKYFTVRNCINEYYNKINPNGSFYQRGNNEDGSKITMEEKEIKKIQYSLLSKKYIKNNNITVDNVRDYIDNIKENVVFIPLEMKVLRGSIVDKYIVKGFLKDYDNNFKNEVYIIVNLDGVNKTFSIEPLNNSYKDLEEIETQNENELIEKSEYNQYVDVKISNEYVSREYFSIYKSMILVKPEIAYQILDNQYKEKRFGDIDGFKKYISKNEEELSKAQCKAYLVNNYQDYREYVCKDQYSNLYIFREKNMVNDISILLDTYTLENEKFTETYQKADAQKKVQMNIDKWVQMLNNRDYTSAYKVLDENFANNTFKGQEEIFENYMRLKYPLHYEISFRDDFSQTNNLYVQTITLKDITGEDLEEKNIDIIMRLDDNLDFVMSFTVMSK